MPTWSKEAVEAFLAPLNKSTGTTYQILDSTCLYCEYPIEYNGVWWLTGTCASLCASRSDSGTHQPGTHVTCRGPA